MQKLGDILSRQVQIQVRLSLSDAPLYKKYTFFPQSFSLEVTNYKLNWLIVMT